MDSPYARRFEGLPFLDVIAKAPISSKSDVFRQCVLARSGGVDSTSSRLLVVGRIGYSSWASFKASF